MRVYKWDSFERKFSSALMQDYVPSGERVLLHSLEIGKGQTVEGPGGSVEKMICLLRGSWRVSVADNQFVVRRNEAIIIPSGFEHRAEAIEDSFALQMIRDREPEEDCLWGV